MKLSTYSQTKEKNMKNFRLKRQILKTKQFVSSDFDFAT